MQGSYQIADLEVTLSGSMKELALAQNVEREFRRACRRLRTQSGADEVFFRVDTELEGENGTFHKFRLRAYAPNSPEVYTIDCGITDENPLGIYVGWNAPIEIYNRETEQVRTIDPETGEVTEGRGAPKEDTGPASNPSGDAAASSTRQNGHESEKMYDTGGQGPRPEQAAQALVQKAKDVANPDELTESVTLPGGDALESKVKGLLQYCDRDQGYLARCLDVIGVQSAGHVAIAELPDLVELIVSEETLRQNEEFEPDDDLPF
jgi:hypothetical protein